MELLMLGSSGTYPSPGGACNCYLLQTKNNRILLDLGPGSLSKLFKWLPPEELDAIFISHLHPDHFTDIFPLRYYLQFSAEEKKLPLKVFAPPHAKEKLLTLFTDSNYDEFDRVFDWQEIIAGNVISIGELTIVAEKVPHLEPTFSLTIKSADKKVFYTSDTAYDEKIAELAAGASLFLCEASLSRDSSDGVAHLSGHQAGKLATMADVSHLVLTHLWPHNESSEILEDAREEFNGIIDLAEDEKIIKVD